MSKKGRMNNLDTSMFDGRVKDLIKIAIARGIIGRKFSEIEIKYWQKTLKVALGIFCSSEKQKERTER